MFILDPRSEFSIPDPGPKRFRIPYPDPHQEEYKYFEPKKIISKLSEYMIREVHPGSGS